MGADARGRLLLDALHKGRVRCTYFDQTYVFFPPLLFPSSWFQVLALAMCAATAEAFSPSFMGQGLGLRQAKSASALSMKIELAPLPYDYTALEPKIGKQTLEVLLSCC